MMSKLDYLKEKADKYKLIFKFILNILLTISISIAGLIYGLITKTLTVKTFWFLIIPLLILFVKLVIIVLIVWKKSNKIDDDILKE